MESIHEGVKFQCPHCDYKATTKSSCNVHIRAIHEGIKFQCPSCSYKATQKNDLKRHIKSQHESLTLDAIKTDQPSIGSDTSRQEYFEENTIMIKAEL